MMISSITSCHRGRSTGFLLVSAILVMCSGCPPSPPSPEEQRQAMTSRWITVESNVQDGKTTPRLVQDDLDRILNSVPRISSVVVERVKSGTIESDGKVVEATVCGTRPEYLRLLEEGARVQLQQGRFFETIEAEEGADVIVLCDTLAKKIFDDVDPVDRNVVLEGRKLSVVGVVSDGAPWGSELTRDAYVPLKLFGPGTGPNAPFPYDRFRFRVEELDQVKNTQGIIHNIIEESHPERHVRVHSIFGEHNTRHETPPKKY